MSNINSKFNNAIYLGDNLQIMSSKDFLKYRNSIKMIYIDPPYNTKSIKTYNDNLDTIDWNKFMKPRLTKAKDFLKEDGCIFISIDDNEFANLKIMCDEIFGKENFVGNFITYQSLRSNTKHINTVHEYVLCYAKNKKKLNEFKIKRIDNPDEKRIIESLYCDLNRIIELEGLEEANKKIKSIINDYCERYHLTWLRNYNNVDEDGRIYFAMDLSTPGEPREVDIDSINLHLRPLPTRGWASDGKFIELYNNNLLSFKGNRPYEKHYLEDACDNVTSVLKYFSRHGTNDLKKLDLYNIFDTPKPVELIKFLIKISTKDDDLILDFFAGSGTTAQAVYEVNEERGSNIKYLLIQLQEPINSKTAVYKECVKKGIEPIVSNILQYRITRYLELSNKTIDYELVNVS